MKYCKLHCCAVEAKRFRQFHAASCCKSHTLMCDLLVFGNSSTFCHYPEHLNILLCYLQAHIYAFEEN